MEESSLEIVVFEVERRRFGLTLAQTNEVHRLPAVVPLPKAPAIVEGVVNLRGKVVPVLDIRARFRLPPKPGEPSDHLIAADAGGRLVGLRVDRVLDLASVAASDIEAAEALAEGIEYVAGVAKLADGLVLIHDLRTFLAEAEAEALDEAVANTNAEAGK